ncbi:MAG: hypothetical protein KDC34_01475 [Saprospiraceae bacterium]|nr:hypothetical protein [Saprospiraceae bacterium]
MKITLLTLPLLFCLAACSTDTTTEKAPISATFYLRYLADGEQLKAEATFLEIAPNKKGKAIEMAGGVSFLGSAMGKRQISDAILRYQYENTGTFPEAILFGCRENSSDTWTEFKAHMVPLNRFKLPDTISTKQATALVLPDGPLTANEQLVMIFSNSDGQAQSVTLSGPSQGNSISIPSDKLNALSEGLNTVYLVKKQQQKIQTAPFIATVEVEYYSKTMEVFVTR